MPYSRRPIISHQPASTLPSRTPGPLGTNILTQSLRDLFNFDYMNVSIARSANEETQEIIKYGANNRKSGNLMIARMLVPKVKKRIKKMKMPWPGWEQHINDVYEIVKDLKCGNCGEYASVAFTLLKKQNVRPLDFVGVRSTSIRSYTHNFVVIGRCSKKTEPGKKVTELPEPKLWGNAAVVCDAYHNKVYPAIILNFMRPGDRFRDSLCRLDWGHP
ncbi:MAG: hypothetical protein KAI50_11510 [Desulfobacterales bacterium]|nr:hypothetical protein [Desulfobacterales bacterium]